MVPTGGDRHTPKNQWGDRFLTSANLVSVYFRVGMLSQNQETEGSSGMLLALGVENQRNATYSYLDAHDLVQNHRVHNLENHFIHQKCQESRCAPCPDPS